MIAAPRAAAATIALLAAASAGVAVPRTWDRLADIRALYGDLDDGAAERAAGDRHHLDPRVWDFYRSRLRHGDRYVLELRRGDDPDTAYERTVVGAYASYWLLPAIRVESREEADVVVTYRVRGRAGAECADGARRYCVERISR